MKKKPGAEAGQVSTAVLWKRLPAGQPLWLGVPRRLRPEKGERADSRIRNAQPKLGKVGSSDHLPLITAGCHLRCTLSRETKVDGPLTGEIRPALFDRSMRGSCCFLPTTINS